MSLEKTFDAAFATRLALREKQIQQSYRPIIGVHKWFARRPGTLFRSLLLSEFCEEPLETAFWKSHQFRGVVADPFMGGGTPIYEANRLGFDVVGTDINPVAFWIVRQSLAPLDLASFRTCAGEVIEDVEREVAALYETACVKCDRPAPVKYFLWVKTAPCPGCSTENDLFPGYLVAEAVRHPRHVVLCGHCGCLNEYEEQPRADSPGKCSSCKHAVFVEGPARRHKVTCWKCAASYAFLRTDQAAPLRHRLFAIEYHCVACKPDHTGRFFRAPGAADLERVAAAGRRFSRNEAQLPIPQAEIPAGDESDRLHRWGYRRYREMFSDRQLLGLGTLLKRIMAVEAAENRHALLTVFSDFLRYQNMLCRYDTYALKCQDIFSVHGFPVGLVQCENNLLGIEQVGSGAFRHFVEKYTRAKEYCERPFETRQSGARKTVVPLEGEHIGAKFVRGCPKGRGRAAKITATPAVKIRLPKGSLDAVFTDPPYFDNVQYAELMDFCFAWLRLGLHGEFTEFQTSTTRTQAELTGNTTLGRGLEHFTNGLSEIFTKFAAALKPGAPFVFTYHHNDPIAYVPLVVAILDAGMNCTATLPAAGEMSASLHISGTGSSVLDSVFVCRRESRRRRGPNAAENLPLFLANSCAALLRADMAAMKAAGLRTSRGDLRCLLAGHIARTCVNSLARTWNRTRPLDSRVSLARSRLEALSHHASGEKLIATLLAGEARSEGMDRAAAV